MNWLDTLKSAVLEEDPKPTVAPVISYAAAIPPSSATAILAPVPSAPSIPSDAFLSKLHSKLNTQGSAVDKFEKTLKSLSGITDENIRLSSALSVVKEIGGVGAPELLQEYSVRRQQLDAEVKNFSDTIAGQRKAEVEDKQSQIAAIDGQLQQLSMQRQSIASTIDEAKARLDRSQAGFDAAVSAVRGEIEAALSKLKGLS